MAPKVPERTSSAGESGKTSNKINKETRLSLEAIRLREQLRALGAAERLLRDQAERLSTETTGREIEKSRRRAFIELFTTSKIGLGITNTGRGKRDPSVQNRFRKACISAYNASNPDTMKKGLWCPITKT
jgi:hypothetical protein